MTVYVGFSSFGSTRNIFPFYSCKHVESCNGIADRPQRGAFHSGAAKVAHPKALAVHLSSKTRHYHFQCIAPKKSLSLRGNTGRLKTKEG